jgi:N-methylhydantoinase A/oxoprolinase/acetone carboxylase beta subunit
VAGYPIRMPALAVHTIGAGGGSIARLDVGGALVVGPESAGAIPGPACYGRGGTQPTVTDADLVLGRIGADTAFAGLDRLDVAAARAALDGAGVTAAGVVAVVDAAMERAVRAVTVEQGVDPREVALVAFGGAGPLHACAVADALGVRTVIVPARAGVFSAVGIVCTPRARELVRSWPDPRGRTGLDAARADLADAVQSVLGPATEHDAGPIEVETFVDCRYAGQSHELTVHAPEEFPAEHARRNGYAREGAPIEVVAIRARASRPAPLTLAELPPLERARVVGPNVVAEPDCTVWVPDGWVAEPGPTGAWLLARVGHT